VIVARLVAWRCGLLFWRVSLPRRGKRREVSEEKQNIDIRAVAHDGFLSRRNGCWRYLLNGTGFIVTYPLQPGEKTVH